jgi:hypothetical protein
MSPFYSPDFLHLHGLPKFIPIALIPLLVIVGFRGTCYYYRKAYYRDFFADPPGCAVGEARSGYAGETKWPWLIQNYHRYFMYLAFIALLMLWWDAICAFFPALGHHARYGSVNLGLGSFVMLLNVILLSGYTTGCHSVRHLLGGRNDCMSQHKFGHVCWRTVTKFNEKHMNWAWFSLFWVCFTDLYIRMGGMGVWRIEHWGIWR